MSFKRNIVGRMSCMLLWCTFAILIVAWGGDDSSGQINSILFQRPVQPFHTTAGSALSEGSANLIWVKCGAQSLPISLDLINPNRVIVFDDKEVSVREPHCQIIVLLSHSAQSRVDKERPATNMDYRGKQRFYIIVNGGWALDTWTDRLQIYEMQRYGKHRRQVELYFTTHHSCFTYNFFTTLTLLSLMMVY